MATLTLTRGLPGSGKTTWARTQPGFRINRDDIRAMLRPTWPHGDSSFEKACTIVQHKAIEGLLREDFDVINDDTNLYTVYFTKLLRIAIDCEANIIIKDFTHVPIEVCIERDAARAKPVGEKVIRKMWDRFLKENG